MSRTYGKLTFDGKHKQWVIECEPHVAIRLKRVFGKADERQFGKIRISASIENSRDMEWFLDRYPLKADSETRALLVDRAREHRERQSLVESLLATRRAPQEFKLALPPRQYQSVAAGLWLASRGLLLADDVGLGKTVTAIAGFNNPQCLPALVVTLTHLPPQWKNEIARFAPELNVHVLRKGKPYDLVGKRTLFAKFPDVIIANYHKLSGWAETIAPLVRSVIFDECQELRRSEGSDGEEFSKKYAAARFIAEAVEYKLGLSATPIYNFGGEMFNVLNILCPGQLGTWQEFLREWCEWGAAGKASIKNPKAFGIYARDSGLMLRRTRQEVGRELPEITVVPHHIETDEEEFEKLRGRAVELAKLILRQRQDYKGQKMQASAEFDMRMRQATGIAKAPFVAEFVRFLANDNAEPVVLYGWHREVYEIWNEKLSDLNPVMFTGTESPAQKEAAKQAFVSGESKVLIISLRSGAGLDGLQNACRIVVFGELDWSPGVHEQCIGRVHRDGQGQPVTVYYLISNSGADPVMCDVLGLKRQQIEGVRDPNADLVTKLQVNEDYIKRLAEKYLADKGVSFSEN